MRVSVVDRSPAVPLVRDAGPRCEDGRGLALVHAMSAGRWGVEPLRVGKRVWADVGVALLDTGAGADADADADSDTDTAWAL
ncbi:ATP-binding protein [Streptomyces sp. SID3343]|uniref:ATP-binding protein n=1 Tax=Streptomyces sp. SID3343 TaxID=2690260 RepID=UPI0013717FF8|nr:ATP-binding protein [Streptomyces sp. SID3343]MYW05524.1 hypothetical protein [Streptomyces sp. SID3343]